MNDLYKKRYSEHRYNSGKRGIDFLLTFNEWRDIWIGSGHWLERGRKKDQYVMSRTGDSGLYAIGNVFIQTCGNNIRDALKDKPGHRCHHSTKEILRVLNTGRPQSKVTKNKRSRSLKDKPWTQARRDAYNKGKENSD
jgi:hypothetical protein